MLKRIPDIFVYKSDYLAGVEILLGDNLQMCIRYVLLEKKDTSLSVVEIHENLASIEDLGNRVPPFTPVFLSIDGKGLIHKILELPLEEDAFPFRKICHLLLPNAQFNDFLVQFNPAGSHQVLASLLRNEVLTTILTELNLHKLFVSNLCLGPFPAELAAGILKNYLPTLTIPRYQLEFSGERIQSFKRISNDYSVPDYQIDEDTIPGHALIAFCNTLYYFNPGYSSLSDDRFLKQQKESVLFQKLLKRTVLLSSLVLLIALVSNLTAFFITSGNNQELSFEYQKNRKVLEQLKDLEHHNTYRFDFIKENDLLSGSRFSYYADRIADLRPKNMAFTRLSLHPLEEELKEGHKAAFQEHFILVEGESNSQDMSHFLRSLEQEAWILQATISSFTYYNQGVSRFMLEIEINNR